MFLRRRRSTGTEQRAIGEEEKGDGEEREREAELLGVVGRLRAAGGSRVRGQRDGLPGDLPPHQGDRRREAPGSRSLQQ